VVVSDINLDGAQAVAADLDGAMAYHLDVTDEDATKAMMDHVAAEWGGIDVIVANAGLPHRVMHTIQMETADFDRMWEINVRSIFFAAKYGVPHMPPGSSIVITASIGGKRLRPNTVPYGASKAAAIGLMKGLAVELAPDIRVNSVNPRRRARRRRRARDRLNLLSGRTHLTGGCGGQVMSRAAGSPNSSTIRWVNAAAGAPSNTR